METEKVSIVDSYKLYKKTVENPVSSKVYLTIMYGFLKFLMSKIFEGYTVRLGSMLGNMGIAGKKAKPVINANGEVKGIAPNWSKTKQHWIKMAAEQGLTYDKFLEKPREERPLVYCFNEHSNGYIYHLNWYKPEGAIINKSYYNFRFSFDNKRALSALVMGGKEYITHKTYHDVEVKTIKS